MINGGGCGVVGRRGEIADGLTRVRARIDAACSAAGRRPDEVTLIAVTKTYPASDVEHLAALGVRDIGENRDQEAAPKAAALAADGVDVRWHYVGQLQRNKARSVAAYAYAVHSVDRLPLVTALATGRREFGDRTDSVLPLDVFVQVSLDGDTRRGGVVAAEVAALAAAIEAQPPLRLAGLMAVAPLGADPDQAFASLAAVSTKLRSTHPEATAISAGMSGDLEAAIRHGATHVRVGSALLGTRPMLG
jgi:pyridoxal phosphate enzyme (YggS family)